MRRWFYALILPLACFGCVVGPDYQRPPVDTPVSWRLEVPEARKISNTLWWQQFQDPVLDELILVALNENKDLRIAVARVEEFLGRYGATRSEFFPQVFGNVEAGRERLTEVGNPPLSRAIDPTSDFYQALLSASWEIDVWGRIRRATEAAQADILASEEGRQSVILTLVSAVATSYIGLRDLDRQLEIAIETAKTREETLKLFELRFASGVISELELAQARSEYEEALATIPELEKFIAQQENALSLLLGRNPGPIPRGKALAELTLPEVPAGIPSDLLERRPDIREAEQNLIAANANIGVARAAYFPSISLSGVLGTASADLSDLFTDKSKVWSLSAPLSVPIFTGGRISSDVQVAEAIQRQALVGYLQTIQAAFGEVEDALVDQDRTREQLVAQSRQVAALQDYARLARLRYDEGYASYLEVLDAERSLFNAELAYTRTQGNLFGALVDLYKAMGGGWITEADMLREPVQAGRQSIGLAQ